MQRITKAHLQAKVDTINELTNSPKEPYTKRDDGHYSANVGNYHLCEAYGGITLHRMHNTGGGITEPLRGGYCTKRELNDQLYAFLRGFDAASD